MIIGHSFIFWAHRRASQCCYTENLSLPTDSVTIYWKGSRGLRWSQLAFHLSQLCSYWPTPSVIIIHAGGNDIGHIKSIELMFAMKRDFQSFKLSFPHCVCVFSESVPRLLWFSSPQLKPLEKVRRCINRFLETCMPSIGGFSYRHIDLEGGMPGLYRSDSIHLSDVGLDLFNLGLQSCVEMATAVG